MGKNSTIAKLSFSKLCNLWGCCWSRTEKAAFLLYDSGSWTYGTVLDGVN
jgi:hypothetical protein